MDLRPNIISCNDDAVLVSFPTPQADSVLELSNFTFGAAVPGPSVYSPSVISAKFTDSSNTQVSLSLDKSMTFGSVGVYTVRMPSVMDVWGNQYAPSVTNFKNNIPERAVATNAYFVGIGLVVLEFNKVIADYSSAIILVSDDTLGFQPVLGPSPFGDNCLSLAIDPGSGLNGSSFIISYSGIVTESLNEISGSIPLTFNLVSPLPSDAAQFSQLQVIGSSFYQIFSDPWMAAVRLYFNAPLDPIYAFDNSSYELKQNDVHAVDDAGSVYVPVTYGDLDVFTDSVNALLHYFGVHTTSIGIHWSTPSIPLPEVATSYGDSLNLLIILWDLFFTHVGNEMVHSAQDPNTEYKPLNISDDLDDNWAELNYLVSSFLGHIYKDFDLSYKIVKTTNGIGSVEILGSRDSHIKGISPLHYYVDLFMDVKSPKASLSYKVVVQDSTNTSTTDGSGYSGSGKVSPNRVIPVNDVIEKQLMSDGPLVVGGSPSLNDLVSRFNNFLRTYSIHLSGPHQNSDSINTIGDSDFSSIDVTDLDLAITGVYSKLKSHYISSDYHFISDFDLPSIDGFNTEKKIDILIESFRRHTKSYQYHQYIYGDLIPLPYRSFYKLPSIPSLFMASLEFSGTLGMSFYDPKNQCFIYSSHGYSLEIPNLTFPASIAGVWFQDGLRWSESGIRFSKDVLAVYFSDRMDMSGLDVMGVDISPSASISSVSWVDDKVLSINIPDLVEVDYSLTFTGLKDINGNSVT